MSGGQGALIATDRTTCRSKSGRRLLGAFSLRFTSPFLHACFLRLLSSTLVSYVSFPSRLFLTSPFIHACFLFPRPTPFFLFYGGSFTRVDLPPRRVAPKILNLVSRPVNASSDDFASNVFSQRSNFKFTLPVCIRFVSGERRTFSLSFEFF